MPIDPVPFSVEGFIGIRDQRSQTFKPGEMEMIYNLVPEAFDRPSALLLRQGFKRFTTSGGSTALQITTGFPRASAFLRGRIGGVLKCVIVNPTGVWVIDMLSATLTAGLTNAQIVAAGASIANFSGACIFNRKLVVADDLTVPWTWSGTIGGGIVLIANAPATGVYSPTVHAGKVFFIENVGSAGSQLLWSEEGDETLGYRTAPYSNFWNLLQTGSANLEDIVGTNDGLVFGRRDNGGVGIIRGDVDANFRTTATKDEIAPAMGFGSTKGTTARPISTLGGAVAFYDGFGRPCIWRPGSGVTKLWQQLPRLYSRTHRLIPDSPWAFTQAPPEMAATATGPVPNSLYYDPSWHCNVFVVDQLGAFSFALLFHEDTDRLVSVWPLTTSDGFGYLGNNGVEGALRVDGSGFIYWQDLSDSINPTRSWSDETSAGVGVPVVGSILGPPHGANTKLGYWWDTAHLLVDVRSQHTVRFGWVTSELHKGSLTPADQTFTESGLSNLPYQRRVEFGLPEMSPARWLMPQWQVEPVAGNDQQLSVFGYALEARPDAVGVGTF